VPRGGTIATTRKRRADDPPARAAARRGDDPRDSERDRIDGPMSLWDIPECTDFEELGRIRDRNTRRVLTPLDVVCAARPEGHRLHRYFSWGADLADLLQEAAPLVANFGDCPERHCEPATLPAWCRHVVPWRSPFDCRICRRHFPAGCPHCWFGPDHGVSLAQWGAQLAAVHPVQCGERRRPPISAIYDRAGYLELMVARERQDLALTNPADTRVHFLANRALQRETSGYFMEDEDDDDRDDERHRLIGGGTG